jgi:hypothetical protein
MRHGNMQQDTTQLSGAYGFRTNEPSYQYYFKQFVFFQGPTRQPMEWPKLALPDKPGD